MEKRRLHLTGAAHLDPVWLWSWREGVQANRATLISSLERMAECQEFIFTTTSAQFYEWIEESEPELFEKIRQRVKEGRWVICGGWWIQPDCNIPSGESFARQGLLAQRYFYERFGVTAKTGFCPDSFGHNAMLPQILRQSGMDHYIFMRPMPSENGEIPGRLFLWQSPDGSRVTTYRLPISYHLGPKIKKGIPMSAELDEIMNEPPYGAGSVLGFFGSGDHGGGPTVRHIREILDYRQEHETEYDVRFSDPERFFAEQEGQDLPVWDRELQYHAPGCYAACSMIKDMNRKAENALLRAEKFDAVSSRLADYRRVGDLDRAWKNLLFNQFHDTLAGSATEAAYFDARNQMGEALAIADRCENTAMQRISAHIGIERIDKTIPVVVFNPHSWEAAEPVEIEMGMFVTLSLPDAYKLVDEKGREIPFQFIDCQSKTFNRRTVVFRPVVPALGYATYRFVAADVMTPETRTDAHKLENEILRVTFDEERGAIESIFDKRLGKYVQKKSARARVIFDDSDTWGHSLKKLDREIGEFGAAEYIPLDTGPVRTAIRYRSYYGDSILTQTYCLYAGEDKIRVDARLDWREKRCALKLDYTAAVTDGTARAAVPFGHVEKAAGGHEEPMQSWADVSGKEFGLAIVNNNKYSVDFRGSTMGLTILRSPIYAHHDPREVEPGEDYNYMDQGRQDFSYEIRPHAGNPAEAGIWRDAMLLNQPFHAMLETYHDGDLPWRQGFLRVSEGNVILTALKQGQDDDCLILRLFETEGKATVTEIRLFDTTFSAKFGAYQVKTFRLKDGKVTEVDFLEWENRRG